MEVISVTLWTFIKLLRTETREWPHQPQASGVSIKFANIYLKAI